MIPMGKFAIRGARYMPRLYPNPIGERSNILLCKIRGWVFFENCRCSPPHILGWGVGMVIRSFGIYWRSPCPNLRVLRWFLTPKIIYFLFTLIGGVPLWIAGAPLYNWIWLFFFFISTRPPLQDIKNFFFSFISKI